MFSDRVRILRKERKMTQTDVAEGCGIPFRTYQDVELGAKPGHDTILKLADFFDVSADFLLARTEDRRLHL